MEFRMKETKKIIIALAMLVPIVVTILTISHIDRWWSSPIEPTSLQTHSIELP